MMQNTIKYILFFYLSLISVLNIKAQNYTEYLELKKKYSGESVVQLLKQQHINIETQKGKLEIYQTVTKKYIFFKKGRGFPFEQSVYTSEFYELVSFEANTYRLEGEKYKKIPVKDYIEKTNSGSYTFYDDQNELKFIFHGISEGTIVELTTKIKIKEPRLLNTVFLSWMYPIQKLQISFKCDAEVKLDLLKFNTKNNNVKFEITETKNSKTFSLEMNDIKGTILDDNAPDIRYFLPHVVPIIRNYIHKNEVIDVLTDNHSLYRWYYTFISDTKEGIKTDAIKALADSITQDCEMEICKIEKLYYWVQKNIKYIAFEYGLGGFIPRKPDEILKNRYGDCKDNSSLLHELAKQAGIKTYFTWIGTNDIPYTYSQVSSPVSDNHMIITYIDTDSNFYFLDATSKYSQLDFPSSFIQGKEALIGINKSDFIIKKVPLVPAHKSIYFDSVNLEINDKVIVGNGNLYLKGYQYIESMYSLNTSKDDNIKEYLEKLLRKGNNKFDLEEYDIQESGNIDTNLNLQYKFELQNFISSYDKEVYVNLNLNKKILQMKLKKDRTIPLAFDYPTKLTNKFTLSIPDNYLIEYVPEPSEYKSDLFEFKIFYSVKENKIYYHHDFIVHTNIIFPKDFGDWRELLNKLENAYKQTILLKKNQPTMQ